MYLSIVIPVYNEQHKIQRDISQAARFLTENRVSGEIIVVDDGSIDNTEAMARKIQLPRTVNLLVESYHPNKGKGYAVRHGIGLSKGRFVMFADSGSCVPYNNALIGINLIEMDECEIAHGSRKMHVSHIMRKQSFFRRFCSRAFYLFITHYMKIPEELTDTQCGFKIYYGDIARELYEESFIDGFTFDIEIILRARRKGYRITEFPIDWTCDPDSRLTLSKSSVKILMELLRIKRSIK